MDTVNPDRVLKVPEGRAQVFPVSVSLQEGT